MSASPTPDTDPNFVSLPNRRKVVIRDLPPALTEDQLLADLDRLGISKATVDYFHFVPGHIPKRNIIAALHMGGSTFHFDPATAVGGKRPRPGQCYLQFKTPEEPIDFAQKYNGHVFVDSRGVQYPARVEYALYQKVPGDWAAEVKANPMEGTWQDTPEFKQWMQLKEETARKAKEPVVFEVKGGAADDVPEPPTNALLSKVAKNAQKLLARARTKANPGGSEQLAASVPVGPSPVAMAILTPKGPKTTPLIEYLKKQREIKLNKGKAAASAGSSPRAANLLPGKAQVQQKQQQQGAASSSRVANLKQQQQGSSRPGSPASAVKPAAGSGKDGATAAGGTDAASDKKARIKEQLKEKRKEKERERRERKKAERAAAKATGKALPSATAESRIATQEPVAKLPTPATSKKAADKLKKDMAAFTPTGIQKRVIAPSSTAPAPAASAAAADDDDQTPVLPFNLIQMSSSATQRPLSPPRIASRAASPASVSSTVAQRGSSPAPSMLSITSNLPETQPGPADVDGDDDEGDQDEQQSQQDQSNMSPEERARLEKLRIKREKRKEKVKEKRRAERVAAKEAKKAARAAAAGGAAEGAQGDSAENVPGAGAGDVRPAVEQQQQQQQQKEVGAKQRPEKKKRARPERNVKKDKDHAVGGDSSIKSAASVNLNADSNPTAAQPSWANNDADQPSTWDSSSTSPPAASQPSSSTPSTRGSGSAHGNAVRGVAHGNHRGSVSSNPPKSPPMQPAKPPAGDRSSDWATADGNAAGGNDWAAAPQAPQHQPRRDMRGGAVRGRGGPGGFVPHNDANPPQKQGPAAAADWATADDTNAGDWNSDPPAGNQQKQQSRLDSFDNVRGAPARSGSARGGAAVRGGIKTSSGRGGGAAGQSMGGEFASVSDWAAASGGGSDWASAEPTAGSGGVDWAGTGDVSDSNTPASAASNRGGREGFGHGARGGGGEVRGGQGGRFQGDFRGGRGGARDGFRGDFRGGRGKGGVAGGPGREAKAQRGAARGDAGPSPSSSWMNE